MSPLRWLTLSTPPPLVCVVAHHPPLNTNHLPRQLLREVPNMKDGPFLSTTGRAPQTDNHSTPSLSLKCPKCPHGPSFPKLNVPKLAGCRFTEASTIRENQSAVVGRTSVPMKLVVWWWFCCVGVAASSERRCESVSSSLNAACQGGARFDASVESVESYMSRSGLLVIMCTTLASWNGSTECDEPMDHLSASFLTNVTGYRVLPSGFGSVVDPLRAKVLCAYPADAATDTRTGKVR